MCRYHKRKPGPQQNLPETGNAEQYPENQDNHANHANIDPRSISHFPNRAEPFHNHGKQKIYKCDKCDRAFQYEYGLNRHKRSDHLHKETVFESGFVFGYFGQVKKPDKKTEAN